MKGFLEMEINNDSLSLKDLAMRRNQKNVSTQQELFAIYQDALNELVPSSRKTVRFKLLSIFSQWQMEHGIYPPAPSVIVRALQEIGFSEKTNNSMRYRSYVAQNPDIETGNIKPWHCCDSVSTAVDLFDRLVLDQYPPLKEYLNRKTTPRLDRILAIVISISLEEGMDETSSTFIQVGQKLAQIRLDQTRCILTREMKREAGLEQKRARKREEAKKSALAAKEKLLKMTKTGRVSNKAIAREAGLSESQVSRILRG